MLELKILLASYNSEYLLNINRTLHIPRKDFSGIEYGVLKIGKHKSIITLYPEYDKSGYFMKEEEYVIPKHLLDDLISRLNDKNIPYVLRSSLSAYISEHINNFGSVIFNLNKINNKKLLGSYPIEKIMNSFYSNVEILKEIRERAQEFQLYLKVSLEYV